MSEVIVVATFHARPGREAALADGLGALVTPTRAEDGCAVYDLHRDLDDPGCFVFVERWQSRAHLDRHLESTHLTAFRATADVVVERSEIHVLEPVA